MYKRATPRRNRRYLVSALALLVLLAGVFTIDAIWQAVEVDRHGATVRHFVLRSHLLDRDLEQTEVVPPGARRSGAPLLLLLPGRNDERQDGLLRGPLFAALDDLGDRAPNVVLVNGGDHSCFHDRRDGRWGSYVLRELLMTAIRRLDANPERVAIGGISMGGWGAFNVARLAPGRFCAVGGHSAAMWRLAGETPEGAFDDAEDFARHDLISAVQENPNLYGEAHIWLDAGTHDPFRSALKLFASLVRSEGRPVTLHTWEGGHDDTYWDMRMGAYMRFYADALETCR